MTRNAAQFARARLLEYPTREAAVKLTLLGSQFPLTPVLSPRERAGVHCR